ncbi:choice-of-anchor Q domain-containing protein [uncultured Demequina sp.]|uniref:choice-of-anchor Q domain-containing protein n=1 Tax=uncultured Demequina sp. TaxID=693499 RepID=UPI0025F519E2|nr:choice-of-anchor Q domain-containing protein [uncultured Demequina sp.]
MTFGTTRARQRAFGAATATAALTAVLATPAGALPGCDQLVEDGEDFVWELECAGDATSPVTLTFTDDIEISEDDVPVYAGDQALTIDGAGYSATQLLDGEGTGDGVFLLAGGEIFGPEAAPSADVTIEDLTIDSFVQHGAIYAMTGGHLTLDGVTITGSAMAGPSPYFFVNTTVFAGGPVTIRDSHFAGNQAEFGGALLAWPIEAFGSEDAEPHPVDITGSTFVGNSASTAGTVFAVGDLTVTDSLFDSNEADFAAAILFDASFVEETGATATITGTTFVENEANLAGAIGGYGTVDVYESSFIGNEAYDGAAIDLGSEGAGDLLLQDTTFDGNVADDGSSVVVRGELVIDGSTFSGNEGYALIDAGAADEDQYAAIVNSTFADNDVWADGVYLEDYLVSTVEHSTFVAADDSEASLLTIYGTVTTIVGSIFTAPAGTDACFGEAESFTAAFNFDADGSCTDGWGDPSSGNIGDGLDPMLGALADNGGPTQTVALLEGSPLIDAVPTGASTVSWDQRGIERPQGVAFDIGAYELEASGVVEPEVPEAGEIEFQVSTPGGTIAGTASPAVAVTDIAWVDIADLPTPPAGAALPFGAATFAVEVPAAGDSVTVTLTAPRPFTSAFKVADSGWEEIAGATFSADRMTVTYTLTDGGELDEDGTANGVIVDPVALAIEATFTG